ncbi:MAG: DUF1508 domain-containing protein [Candidatus Paceibacterota bacterium]
MGKSKWEFYKDTSGDWRWRKTASNGKIVGASSEGFSSKTNAVNNAKLNGYQGS